MHFTTVAMPMNPEAWEQTEYRANSTRQRKAEGATTVEDFFDSEHYRKLCNKKVEVDGEKKSYRYFKLDTDIALALSLNGVKSSTLK
ncbi:hypothetical protein BDV98DRAFT_568300 [Pterulicium gracile]|uniref:Uncharacterized protein n=1 Tax=Pterulicium gracile TaxID=1884261 RepID=A0A5C3QG03_9AGAR|nr:hypothetical protein BDV98DRAFT_568300 [Pterula gracilis]